MHPLCATKKEQWLDCLWELEHDLGKYLNLPLLWLPEGADDSEVKEAVREALLETRRGPRGTRGARQIWDGFASECEELLEVAENGEALVLAVQKAFAWQDALKDPAGLNRGRVSADFKGVTAAIRVLIEEVRCA